MWRVSPRSADRASPESGRTRACGSRRRCCCRSGRSSGWPPGAPSRPGSVACTECAAARRGDRERQRGRRCAACPWIERGAEVDGRPRHHRRGPRGWSWRASQNRGWCRSGTGAALRSTSRAPSRASSALRWRLSAAFLDNPSGASAARGSGCPHGRSARARRFRSSGPGCVSEAPGNGSGSRGRPAAPRSCGCDADRS